jgi:hypothetical protein
MLLVALMVAVNGVSEARSKFMFWCGMLVAAAGAYAIGDGLQMVQRTEYGDVAKPAYNIPTPTGFNVTTTVPYSVTGMNGTITNTGNTLLTNIVVQGSYVDSTGNQIQNVTSSSIASLAVNQSTNWSLPDATNLPAQPDSTGFQFTATYQHTPIYGSASITQTKDENEAYVGIAAVLLGGYLVISYLNNKEINEEDLSKKNDFNINLASRNGMSRLTFSARI